MLNGATLSFRALNRATLKRQSLLSRSRRSAPEMIEQLVGIQAQAPLSPYVGLWTRLAGFSVTELSELIRQREVVRGWLMRATVHLVTAADYAFLRPLTQPVLERSFAGQPFSKQLNGISTASLLDAGRALLAERPRSRIELGRALASRFSGVDPGVLGMAMTYLEPMIQAPPRGVWGERTQVAPILEPYPVDLSVSDASALVLRYLGAFGPATVRDIQQWSGLTRLQEVTDGLGSRLLRFEDGYLDLPDAPRPPADIEAPVRFLPEYDNLLLSHAVRTRFIPDGRRVPLPAGNGGSSGTVLVDGLYRADWRLDSDSLVVQPFQELSKRDRLAVETEGLKLLDFVAPGTSKILFLAS